MITDKDAEEIAKKYLLQKKREYIVIKSAFYEESSYINYGKYEDSERSVFIVPYEIEGYQNPIAHFISIDGETGEVLYTTTPHGYAEEWED